MRNDNGPGADARGPLRRWTGCLLGHAVAGHRGVEPNIERDPERREGVHGRSTGDQLHKVRIRQRIRTRKMQRPGDVSGQDLEQRGCYVIHEHGATDSVRPGWLGLCQDDSTFSVAGVVGASDQQ